jgi:hypothetical protein
MTHPSFFALDSHALDPKPGEVESHVASCTRCQAHLAALRAQSPLPPGIAGLPAPEQVAPWWRVLALAFAAAAIILAVVAFSTREQPQLLTAKGTPTAALWLNRAGKSSIWNGEPIHAGDSVRIEVVLAGFTHVTVFDENTRQVLYEAVISEGSTSLTPAWEFDGKSPSESLRVVLSRAPASFGAKCENAPESFCTRFVLTRANQE